MNLWAILPVKKLAETKSRLSGILSPEERAQLTQTLLVRTLGLLQMVTAVNQTIVVSRDPIVAKMAAAAYGQVATEPAGSGLNGAVTIGAALAAENDATHLLVLPADLPFLSQDELELLIDRVKTAVSPNTLFICSDQKQQGTNALVLPAGRGFRFYYGRNSYHHHQAEAIRLGWTCQAIHLPSIQFDLDIEQDYNRYANQMIVQGKCP
jgi:2-phospho-L-lactate/phosphoenolpyruvate guanylyltransferase